MLKITILTLALALPLSAGFVGPELPLSTTAIEPAPGLRERPAVASNGEEFLVVWADAWSETRAARVDASGVVRDRESLRLGLGRQAHDVTAASIASDGRDYVVAFPCGNSYLPAACLAHVEAATGAVTRRGEIAGAAYASIASNGRGYLVAYRTSRGVLEAVPLRVDGTIAGAPYSVATTTYVPKIASNGEAYFVVYGSRQQLSGVLLSERGPLAERQRFSDGTILPDLDVAWSGSEFLVIWSDLIAASDWLLRTARVSSGGSLSAERGTLPGTGGVQHDLEWNGTRYTLTFTAGPDVAAMELDREGRLVGGARLAEGPRRNSQSAVASNGTAALAVWTSQWGQAAEIGGRLLTRSGSGLVPGDPFVVSLGATAQRSAAATRNGSRTVVAWDENVGPEQRRKVYVQRLDATAAPLDGRGLPVGDSPRHQLRPALAGLVVAWIEVDPLADWSAPGEVWAAALDFSGAPIGAPVFIGTAAQTSRVAVVNPGGPLQFILWQSPDGRILAARFSAVSRVGYDPAPFAVSSGPLDKDPIAVSNGNGFLVTWSREQRAGWGCVLGCTFPTSIHAAAFTIWGDLVGTAVEVAPVESSFPVLVWNGAEYALFWSSDRTTEAFVQRLSAGGTPIAAPRSLGKLLIEAVAWAGNEYRLAISGYGRDSLAIGRLDRDLTRITAIPTVARQAAAGVVLFEDLLIYLAPYRGNDWISSRAVARRLGENAAPPRRRTTGS